MPNAFAISMTRPRDTLGIPRTLGQRIPHGIEAWNIVLATLTIGIGLAYVIQVSTAATKSYELRRAETRVESLKTEAMMLQDKIVALSSMQNLNTQAAEIGFVPVDRIQYVNPVGQSYALAR